MTTVPMPEPDFSFDCDGTPCYYADTVRAYGDARAKEARAEALKEAEQACERIHSEFRDAYKGRGDTIDRSQLYNPHTDGCSDGAFEAAEAVRALMKEQG